MNLELADKVALITGGSSGLGAGCALELAREGACVAVAARRPERLQQIADRARTAGSPDARAFAVDLDDERAIERLIRDVTQVFGRIDILIANGGGPKPGTFMQTALHDWDDAYKSVLRSMLQLIAGVVPGMRERRWGRVVALTSTR